MSETDASNLVADTKEKIIPLIKVESVPKEEQATTTAPATEVKPKPVEDIFPKIKPSEVAVETAEEPKPAPAATPEKKMKKPSPAAKEPALQAKQINGSDKYRESIE